jgi:hypothetical protein
MAIFTRIILILLTGSLLLFSGCKPDKKAVYTKHPSGFYYQLISFMNDENRNNLNHMVFLNATFSNQADSVFWNSNTDFNNKLFLYLKKNEKDNLIEFFLENANEGDSAILLIPVKTFFNQQFASNFIPSFCKNDSVVKVHLKIAALYPPSKSDSIQVSWANQEKKLIRYYLQQNQIKTGEFDSLGVYWISPKPASFPTDIPKNRTLELVYKGYLLSGKQFDESPENWQVNTATPDQMLRGINYVIKYLREGENAKIILPSYLAFGEMGSGTIIAPFTPLLYEINVKNTIN